MRYISIALIPAYEPEPILIGLLEDLNESGVECIVVDDGSGEDYTALFEKAGDYAVVLHHEVNRGKGCALKTGYSYIREHYEGDAVIVTMDADGQHRVADAMRLCAIAATHTDTLVLGSRRLNSSTPLRSKMGNTITRMVYRFATGVNVYDTQTGLRAFHIKMLPRMTEIAGDRYEYEMNVLMELARQKTPIREEEIETIYINDNAGSHFDTVRDSVRVYKEIFKFSVSSLVGFLTDYCLFFVLSMLTGNLPLSNVGARCVSATVNYTLNRKLVFRSNGSVATSAASYFALAALILIGNTAVLSLLVNTLGIPQMAAKLLTEILFFALSYFVQKNVIFKKKELPALPQGRMEVM